MTRFRALTMAVTASLIAPLLFIATTTPSASASTPMPSPSVSECDSLVTTPVGHDCLLPWPNDAFTKAAPTPTGRLVNISADATPENVHGVHINPKYENQNDGFSPGSVVLINVPNLSLTNSNIAPSTDIGSSGCTIKGVLTNAEAPVVLWDTNTKKCVPYFAELDAQDSTLPRSC